MSENSPKTKLQLRKDYEKLYGQNKLLSMVLYEFNIKMIEKIEEHEENLKKFEEQLKKYEELN